VSNLAKKSHEKTQNLLESAEINQNSNHNNIMKNQKTHAHHASVGSKHLVANQILNSNRATQGDQRG